MLTTAALLAVMAAVLAWPVPVLLSRASWPAHAPGTALLLWQAIALAGGLSMIGALLIGGLVPFGSHPIEAAGGFADAISTGRLPTDATFPEMFALSGAILLTVHLLANLALTIVRTRRQRRRHLQLLQLLSAPVPERPGVRLLDHEAPVAYCLPAAPRSVTVLSAGLLEMLNEGEVQAVVAHERAHVDQRHHTVLMAFEAWHGALPWFPITTRAHNAVGLLIEMLADDAARRNIDDQTLTAAIRLAASDQPGAEPTEQPTGSGRHRPVADKASIDSRVARLANGFHPLGAAARVAIAVVAIALVVGPPLLFIPSVRY